MRLDNFWRSKRWAEYERAYGDAPGTRSALLADNRWATRVVDLSVEPSRLWAGVRRSYHSPINRATREFDAIGDRVDGQSAWRSVLIGPGAGGLIRTAQRLHLFDAGRQTRPDETWDLLGDWADDGGGLLSMAWDASITARSSGARGDDGSSFSPAIGFAYFIIDGEWAYYASAATVIGSLNASLVWWAIQALKARGVRWCEMGWQGQATDEKGQAIEFFRRGFGGVDVPFTKELE